MKRTRTISAGGLVVAAFAVAAAVLVAILIARSDLFGTGGSGLGNEFTYDLTEHRKVDPSLLAYRLVRTVATPFKEARGLAVGPDGALCVAGDSAVAVFAGAEGEPLLRATDEPPRAVAVTGSGQGRTIYVAAARRVEAYDEAAGRWRRWADLDERAMLTSLAATDDGEVFAADAGNRVVLRYGPDGQIVGRIGAKDPDRNIPGLQVPSPHLDVAIGADGLLRVTNPGRREVEAYTFDGDLELSWGTSSVGIEGFCGCCNPTDIAVLPDGGIVTSEKGLPRVKVYDATGKLLAVVAPPEAFDEGAEGLDLATDAGGRIYVLDPRAAAVRVYEKTNP